MALDNISAYDSVKEKGLSVWTSANNKLIKANWVDANVLIQYGLDIYEHKYKIDVLNCEIERKEKKKAAFAYI